MGQSDLGNGVGSFCFALTVILQLGLCALILCQRFISTLVSGHLWCIQFSLVQVHIHCCSLLNSRGDNSDLGAIAANHHDHHQEPPQTVVLFTLQPISIYWKYIATPDTAQYIASTVPCWPKTTQRFICVVIAIYMPLHQLLVFSHFDFVQLLMCLVGSI